MSRALAMSAPAQAAKTAMPVSARTSTRASARGRTNIDAPADEGRLGEQRAADESRLQWSIGQMALEAPLKSSANPDRRGLPAEVRRALVSSIGEKLPETVAGEFGRKFRRDLSDVRIHRDGVASEAVESIGANAFARGSDLYFRAGAYQPDSLSGQALLAHELAHTIQQAQSAKGASCNVFSGEEHAQRAARHHAAGHPFLSAGPPMPVAIAADNGVSFEDEYGQVSRLGTDQEAAEKVADLQQEADRARAAAGVTDAHVAAIDEKAQKLRETVQDSVAKKQAAKRKAGKGAKAKKGRKTPAAPVATPAAINSSTDLTNASLAEVEQHQRQLEVAMALTPDLNSRLTIARAQENTQTTAAAAANREQYKRIKAKILDQHSDIESLKRLVQDAQALRESTSSWVTGPTHFYGGAWNEIEIEDFSFPNQSLNDAEKAASAGRYDEAEALIQKSWNQWWDLNHRFVKYAEGIQKGGQRVVTGIKLVEKVNRAAASLNPALGAAYSFGQDSLQQGVEVHYGQRDSVDWGGNLKNAAISYVVGKASAGGSNFAGEAAAPYLTSLGRFSGFGRQVVEQGTGIVISSGLTGTSPIDALEDPTTYLVPFIGSSYAHGGGKSSDTGETSSNNPAPETIPATADLPNGTERTGADAAQVGDATTRPDKTASTLDDGTTVADSAAAATDAVSVKPPENVSHLDPALHETSTAHTTGNETGVENSTRIDDPLAADTTAKDKVSKATRPDDLAADDKVTGDEIWSHINDEMGLEHPPDHPAGANPAKNEPVHAITDPNKSRGVGGEVTVPFDRYSGPEWNHIGGGSETASSRANLARRSSHDIQMGQEGTAGNDYLVKNRQTKQLVIGEQKATQGNSFTDATAITSSLEQNVTRDIEVLEEKVKSGEIQDPAEVADVEETIVTLKKTREALQKGAKGEQAQLPDGVVFEFTNLGGEGKQIGKGHIDLLAENYGKNPEFLEHLLDRTAVRDPELAKAQGRDPNGKRGTASDPDIVPAKDILTPKAQDTLDRLRAGKTEKQWQKQKASEKAKQINAEKTQREVARKAQKQQRADAESAAREQARQAGDEARQERLKQFQDEKAQKGEPEGRTKAERDKARRALERNAKDAGKEVEKGQFEKFLEARKQQEADALAARRAEEQEREAAARQKRDADLKVEQEKASHREQTEREAAARQAKRKAQADAIKQLYEARKAQEAAAATSNTSATDKPVAQADKPAQGAEQTANLPPSPEAQQEAQQEAGRQKLEGARKAQEAEIARSQADTSGTAASKTDAKGTETNKKGGSGLEATKTATSPNEVHTPGAAQRQENQPGSQEGQYSTATNPPEKTGTEHENTAQPHEGAGGKAIHAANQAAGSIRAYDAYQETRNQGKSRAEASIEAGKAYLSATNPVAGAASTAVQRMQKDEKGEQYYGNDALDAWLGTIGETGAGFIVPGEKWDQAVNAAGNVTDAVDDHMEKNRDPKAPRNNKATVRTGVDLAAELTPSREFSAVIGAGTRAYYDLGRAGGGDTSGVDKFGEDATRGKLGSIIQPWAMAADFAGNLGNSTPSQALDKTIKKTEGTTLKKTGDALGDAAFNLGQNKEAKAGKYGSSVQGIAGALSMSSDMIAGKTFEQALNNAAAQSKDSTVAKVGDALGDAAFTTVQKGKKLINEDLPAAKKKAAAVIDESKEKISNWWKKL
jgi:hypothetical protein